MADISDPALKHRIAGLKSLRDQAQVDAERAQAMLESTGNRAMTLATVRRFADVARQRIKLDGGGYRQEHLRAFGQRVEVAEAEVHIMGSKGELLRTLTAVSGGKSAGIGVPRLELKWRKRWEPLGEFSHCFYYVISRCRQAKCHTHCYRNVIGYNRILEPCQEPYKAHAGVCGKDSHIEWSFVHFFASSRAMSIRMSFFDPSVEAVQNASNLVISLRR